MSEKKNSVKNIMLHPAKDKYISSYFLPGSSAFCPENLSEATFQSNGLSYRYVNIGYIAWLLFMTGKQSYSETECAVWGENVGKRFQL